MKKYLFSAILTIILFILFKNPAMSGNDIPLSPPPSSAGMDLAAALQARSSVRMFSDKEIPVDELSRILWAGYGITRSDGKRTIPTAWNRRMLNLYVFNEKGIYRYEAEKNMLCCIKDGDARSKITAFTSSFAAKAPVVILITTNLSAGPFYAGRDEKIQNSAATTGACCQSIYLMATARKLGTCMIAGFDINETRSLLRLENDEIPLYIMPLGYAKEKLTVCTRS